MKTMRKNLLLFVVLSLLVSGCVVSEKDYLLKEEEAAKCSQTLRTQVEENRALTTELSSCQSELSASEKRVEKLTESFSDISAERNDLEKMLTAQQAVSEELKAQNYKLGELLQEKEVAQSSIIRETMEINRRLQETNIALREKQAVSEAERGRIEKQLETLNVRNAALEKQKEAELQKLKATYDELVGSLKGEIEAGEIQIRRMQDRLSVNLVEKILFDSGKAALKQSGVQVLRKVGAELAKIKDKRIQIEGHTDNVPIGGVLKERFPSNWELSAARAMAVVHFLQNEVGIAPVRLSAAAYGEYQPASTNETVEGKAANRRIEIVILPLYERISEAKETTTTGPEK